MSNKSQDTTFSESDAMSSLKGLTSPQILFKRAEKMDADNIAIREKAFGIWQSYSWREYLEYVKPVCLGLISLGIKRGENVALITGNRPEWLFCEMGAMSAGAVIVNLYTSAMGTELVHDLNRLDAAYVFVENRRQAEKLLRHRSNLSRVRGVIFIDPDSMTIHKDDPWLISYSQLIAVGKRLEEENPALFTDELWKGSPDDSAMILMTSGTTGIPKPAMISYAGLMETALKWVENLSLTSRDNWVSFSPCAGLIEQTWCAGTALACGMIINFPETLKTAMIDIREIGPSIIVNYPLFWERLMSFIKVEMEESGPFRKWVYGRAWEAGKIACELELKGSSVTLLLKLRRLLYSRVMLMPLMDQTGLLRVRHAYTGGNPISPETVKFFRVIGLNLKQCYGLAETGGMFQFQPDGDPGIDTVGRPLHGTEASLTEDNELVVSGMFKFSGYYNDPEATSASLKNGRLHTGDCCSFDDHGRLVITGKKEDIISSRDNRTFSRDFIESRVKESPYIRDVVLWGKGKPYLIAFIGIDFDNVMRWADRHDVSVSDCQDLLSHPDVEGLIRDEIYNFNSVLPAYMRIRKIILINRMLESHEEFTRSGMARRKFLFEQYRNLLDVMYSEKDAAAMTGRVRDDNDDIRTVKAEIRIITVPERGQQDYV
jgi:long-chain acyl-CoA synthetase